MDANDETQKILVLNQVEQHLKFHYYPASTVVDASLLMTTMEIYLKLQRLITSDLYHPNDIVNIMTKLGYKMVDMGRMDYQWLLAYEMR